MKLEQINQIAVLGLGRMGHGIVQSFAMGGYRVRGFDMSAEACKTVYQRIGSNLEAFVQIGLLDAEAVGPILGRIEIVDSVSQAAADAQFVVEAIAEDLTAKEELFAQVEDAVGES